MEKQTKSVCYPDNLQMLAEQNGIKQDTERTIYSTVDHPIRENVFTRVYSDKIQYTVYVCRCLNSCHCNKHTHTPGTW